MYSLTISGRYKGRDGGLIPTPLIFVTKQRAMAQSWGSNNFVLARGCLPSLYMELKLRSGLATDKHLGPLLFKGQLAITQVSSSALQENFLGYRWNKIYFIVIEHQIIKLYTKIIQLKLPV